MITKKMNHVKKLLNEINLACVKGLIPREHYVDFVKSLKENLPTRKQLQDIKQNAI